METTEKTKTTRLRKQVEWDWQDFATYAGTRVLEGSLFALGGVLVTKGVQSLTKPKAQAFKDGSNVVPFNKTANG